MPIGPAASYQTISTAYLLPTTSDTASSRASDELPIPGDASNITEPSAGASEVSEDSAPNGNAAPADFRNMTRQELFDWMNSQIRSGEMTIEESTPFLAMTVKISAATGQPVDIATDTERLDFIELARLGIEFARSTFDEATVERLQTALQIMDRHQDRLPAGIDLLA